MKSTEFYVGSVVLAAAILFAALLADALGLFDGRPPSAPKSLQAGVVLPHVFASAKPGPAAAAPAGADAASLAEENRRLEAQNRDLQARLVAVLNWILQNFKGRYPLPEESFAHLQVPPLDDNFLLTPELVNLLKIKPEEEQKINDAFAYARQYLSDIEAAIVTVTNPRPDKAILNFPTFPEDGKQLQDDLYGALEITLGQDRFDRFIQVADQGLRSNFYQFGEASRTIVFELAYPADGGVPMLKIKDGWVMEVEPGVRTVTATESVVTNLPSRYQPYIAWLPDYVSAYSVQ